MTYGPTKTEPWQHQREAFALCEKYKGVGLWLDMGTGKSKVVVDFVRWKEYALTLIVCPKSVLDVWPKQFAEHCAEPLPRIIRPNEKKSCAARAKEIVVAWEASKVDGKQLVVIVNFEAIIREPLRSLLVKMAFNCVIADEIHRIKKPGGKASIHMKAIGTFAQKRLGLSGTPLPHSPLDAYAIYRFLDRSIFGKSYVMFRGRYAVMGGFENRQVIGWANEAEFRRLFSKISMVVDSDDVLDIPKARPDQWLWADMPPKTRKVYETLKTSLIAGIVDDKGQGKIITAANVLVKLLRLQQITGGRVPEDAGNAKPQMILLDSAKIDRLREWMLDLKPREPVVVFARFLTELDQVREMVDSLGDRGTYCELSGRRNDLKEWQDSKPHRVKGWQPGVPGGSVLGVQIQAGGVGIDLTRSRYVVYFSTGWSLGDYKQSRKRVHRPGQNRRVTYYHLGVRNTVDDTIKAALKARTKLVDYFLEHFEEEDAHIES